MCVHRESGAQRAVKVLRKSHMDEEEKRMLFNEINILKEIVSPLSNSIASLFAECFYFHDTKTLILSRSNRNFLLLQDHPNIVKMYEFFEDDKRYYLVTE